MPFAPWLLLAAATVQLAPDAPAAEPRLASVSTTISPSLCAPMEGGAWRCAGYAGIEVRLFGPEEGRTIALGAGPPAFSPLPLAGRLGRSIDWRLQADGTPQAVLVRWQASEGSAELVLVLRPVRGTAPSCLSAVAVPVADLDELAARRFRCGHDRPVLAGPVPPALRAALEPWLLSLRP